MTTQSTPVDAKGICMDESTMAGTAGYFRVGKSRTGRWWLVDPDGKPFLYRGVAALWMPDDYTGAEAARFRKHWESTHGSNREQFVSHCFRLLQDRGFNALGEWATPYFWNRGVPFTVLVHVRHARPESNITEKIADVFDPAWEQAYNKLCAEICAPQAHSRDLVGYYVDNEGHWGTARRDFVWGLDNGPMVDRNVLGMEPLLLQTFLTADPRHPGHRVAWDWLLERYQGSVSRVAAAWGSAFESPAHLRALTDQHLVLASRSYRTDHEAFTALYVRRYFAKTAEAIRRHDPNHLLLGPRFGGTPGDEVLNAMDRRYLDVVSWNCYNLGFRKRCDEFHRATGLPQINGEYSWASGTFLDWNKLMAKGTFSDAEKARCAHLGQATLEQAIAHPALIGYTWYKFCYDAVTLEQPSYGLIDPTGLDNAFNRRIMQEVNGRLEAIARGDIEPMSVRLD